MAQDTGSKHGMTVQEIESMVKKYKFEVFFCLSFLLAALFSYFLSMMGWCILLSAVGAVAGMLLPGHAEKIIGFLLQTTCKQERVTQIIIGVVLLLISMILSPLIYLFLGFVAGKSLYKDTLHHKGQHLHSTLDEKHKG
jgi:membrane associated rhomboid family serine protease